MQTLYTPGPGPLQGRHVLRYWPDTTQPPEACVAPAGSDGLFVALLSAYRCSGGLAREDEVLTLLERRGGLGVAMLARWIVERSVISFEWQSRTWLPWFQFKRLEHVPDPALVAVFAELTAAYDRWQVAHWFALANPALAGRTPVGVMAGDPDAVLQAARADRFVAKG